MITDEQIAELERLDQAATLGPWDSVGKRQLAYSNNRNETVHAVQTGDRGESVWVRWDIGGQNSELIATARNLLPSLLQSYKALKEENERHIDLAAKFGLEAIKLTDELERTRDLCVVLESHIADLSLARFRHVNVDRFIPELGYPDGIDSEIDVASPFEIHPEGAPQ